MPCPFPKLYKVELSQYANGRGRLDAFCSSYLAFYRGSGILHYEACYKILEKTLTPSNVISFRNNMEQFARYLLGILAHSKESPTSLT